MTFDELVQDSLDMTKDTSVAARNVVKRGINKGLVRLRGKLKRNYSIVTRQFTIDPAENGIQMPENAIRLSRISYIEGGQLTKLIRVDDENEWDRMQGQQGESGRPQFYFIESKDVIRFYPKPSVAATGVIKYQSRAKQLSVTDYKEGTISVTNGSQNVTGNGTTFTEAMVGRSIKLATSNEDKSDYYRIIAVSSPTALMIENLYDGADKVNEPYLIGEVPNLPEEYHPSLSDYGLYYFYLWRKDKDLAAEFNANFIQTMNEINTDSSDVVSSVIESKRARGDDNLPSYKRSVRAI